MPAAPSTLTYGARTSETGNSFHMCRRDASIQDPSSHVPSSDRASCHRRSCGRPCALPPDRSRRDDRARPASSNGTSGRNTHRVASGDHAHDPGTSGPARSPRCTAMYCSMPGRIACENSTATVVLGSTAVAPPAGVTDVRTAISPGSVELPVQAAAVKSNPPSATNTEYLLVMLILLERDVMCHKSTKKSATVSVNRS